MKEFLEYSLFTLGVLGSGGRANKASSASVELAGTDSEGFVPL